MKLVWLAAGCVLTVCAISPVNAGQKAAAMGSDTDAQMQKPVQAAMSSQYNKSNLSRRNQAKIKQTEAAKIRQEAIDKANANRTKP
jgi:hypothetical protein